MNLIKIKSISSIIATSLLVIVMLFSKLALSNDLSAYLYLAQFKSPADGPYIETYLNIVGNTVKFEPNSDGQLQSKVEVLYLFKQGGEIKVFEKYVLESPLVKNSDSTLSYPNFTDVQRIAIGNGVYNLELKIQDLYDSTNVFTYNNIVKVDMDKKYQFSDIELVESFKESSEESVVSKNGLDIVPFVSTFYSEYKDTIMFYAELYNNDKPDDFLLQYYIEKANGKKKLNQFSHSKKVSLTKVLPIFSSFEISELKTGNYNLVLSLRDKQNTEVCRKQFFFQRFNNKHVIAQDTIRINNLGLRELPEITDVELMKDYIKSTIPILNQRELYKANNVMNSNDIELMKTFFNNYWQSVSDNPEQDWSIYKLNVERVNLSYSSQIKRGYETDRGRVFLKYGKPNDINKSEHEPSSYPYEIWHYFEVNGETNKRFIFYNPDLVGEDFQLLHSDLTGEKNNPYWQRDLTKRNSTSPDSFDDRRGESQYGNRSQDLYGR